MILGGFILWVILAIAAGIVAANKNRSVAGWVILTFLLAPLFIILLVLPKLPGQNGSSSGSGTKKCPSCAEDIKIEAVTCRFCNKDFPAQPEFKP